MPTDKLSQKMAQLIFLSRLVVAATLLAGSPAIAATLIVTNTGDGGPGSLRQAIETANSNNTDDSIEFNLLPSDPGYNGTFWTINLATALPDLSTTLDIRGPGPKLLTVQRQSATQFRIFNITAVRHASISGLRIRNGSVAYPQMGGGISSLGAGNAVVSNCAISDNVVTSTSFDLPAGGGIYHGGFRNLTIINSTISNNAVIVVQFSVGRGGGLSNGGIGAVNVSNSTISGNSAYLGGGISNSSGAVNLTNSTVSGNSSFIQEGGGIINYSTGTVNVSYSTISGNSGEGLRNIDNGSFSVTGSVVALNTNSSNRDVFGPYHSDGFNVIGRTDGSTGFSAPTDQTGTVASPLDPKLDPAGLQPNGGPTQTIALLPGSPAIDHGDDTTAPLRDQRDYGRYGAADAGAFEFAGTIPATLANISTRLAVETGDNVLIGGFIITGTYPKKVIVRAIGPSLPVAGALVDPSLELRDSSGALIRANDNWRSDQEADITATTIPPTSDLESALVETLPANGAGYTTIVRGVNNGTGVGLLEAYDLDRTVDSKLANISTRGLVQTDDNVMIAGTIVLGASSQRVLVRAIGPSLPVAERLQDPALELHDGNGALIRANDNWRSDQEAEILATGISPSNDLESALVETLPSGGAAYTAIVRGVNATTGVALVEVYSLN